MKDVIWTVIILSVVAYACTPGKLEDRPDYKKGYEAGLEEGQEQGRDDTCQEIRHAKDSIYDYLRDERICP